MPNNGEEYELLVKEVYEILNSIDGLEDVNLQHNIQLKGKSRAHQTDIYWEFKKAGIPFRVVVECKDYKNPVKAEKIEAFKTVLMDLNDPIGIYVTKHGYQKGAIDVAKNYGIQLMVIHGPEDEDWNGYIKTFHIDLVLQMIEHIRVLVVVDKVWAEENSIHEFHLEGFMDSEVYLCIGDKRESLRQIAEEFPRDKEGKDFKKILKYDKEDVYIECRGTKKIDDFRYKIKGFEFTYDIHHYHDSITIDAANMIKAFVKNVIEEETKIVDTNGNVRLQGEY